jgi:hypothetical protein
VHAQHRVVAVIGVQVRLNRLDHTQPAVAERLGKLNRIHPATQGLCCELVPQKVGMDGASRAGTFRRAAQQLEHSTRRQRCVLP